MSIKRHINNPPEWKRLLIQSVKELDAKESLIELIQNKKDIIIASSGSKATTKSGAAWIFTNNKGNILIAGHNLDFGIITEIHSHRSEIFGLLSALIFLEEYCRYYFVKFESTIQYHCENLEVVNKVKGIQSEKRLYSKAYEITDHDAVLALKYLIPRNMTINHVKNHAKKIKKKEHFTLPEALNSKVDEIITANAKKPINTHILNTPIAVYIHN